MTSLNKNIDFFPDQMTLWDQSVEIQLPLQLDYKRRMLKMALEWKRTLTIFSVVWNLTETKAPPLLHRLHPLPVFSEMCNWHQNAGKLDKCLYVRCVSVSMAVWLV